jgi:hypothetical protein
LVAVFAKPLSPFKPANLTHYDGIAGGVEKITLINSLKRVS